jgi:hypothetical protein
MRSTLRLFFALTAGLLLAQAAAARADDKPARLRLNDADIVKFLRTDYFGVYVTGEKVGWAKETLSRTGEDKDARYLSETELSIKIVSAGVKSEMQQFLILEYDAKAPYALRRAVSKESNGRQTKEVEVTRTDKGFEATITQAGEKVKKQLAELDYTLADALSTNLWLARGAKVGDTLVTPSFDFDDLKLDKDTRKLLATKTSVADGVKVTYQEVEATFSKDNLKSLERYDGKGERMLSMHLAGDAMELRLEPEKEAKDVKFSRDLFVLGSVKIDKALGDTKQLAGLIFEVVGGDAVAFKSGPQQAVQSADGKVICKLGKSHGEPLKATEKEIEENLTETALYPISHPKIVALAKEAVGDAKTPREKVERLVRFVNGYLIPSYSAEPLGLLDVLKVKKGDCKHYALLFTALARANGIPTREVGGLLYMGDDERSFGPHAWNEVVLDGVWVPIDASCNQTEIDAGHVRFGARIGDTLNLLAAARKMTFKLVELERKQ